MLTLRSTASIVGQQIHEGLCEMTAFEVLNILRTQVINAGGVAEWSRQNGVDPAAVSRAITGAKPPPPAILKALGLVRRIDYVRQK